MTTTSRPLSSWNEAISGPPPAICPNGTPSVRKPVGRVVSAIITTIGSRHQGYAPVPLYQEIRMAACDLGSLVLVSVGELAGQPIDRVRILRLLVDAGSRIGRRNRATHRGFPHTRRRFRERTALGLATRELRVVVIALLLRPQLVGAQQQHIARVVAPVRARIGSGLG